MNNNPKISVIVPVYNAEKYLRRCIDSILAQTFADFELLLIDDGSTDSSGKICDEYEVNDSRVKVYHQKNGGASEARNTGINKSRGAYIVFIDSDDYAKNSFLQNIINCGKSIDDVSLVLQSPIRVYSDGKQKRDIIRLSKLEGEKGVTDFIKSGYLIYSEPHCKLFNAQIIRKNKITFPPNIIIGEDGIFIAEFLKHAKTIIVSNENDYYYSKNNSSIQSKRYSYNVERNGFELWKHELCDLCKSLNIKEYEQYIWPLLSIPMNRAILSICQDTSLSLLKKHRLMQTFECKDFKNYGRGRDYGLKGNTLKVIINWRMIWLIILLSKILRNR